MIIVNSPIMQKQIQKIVEGLESPKFTFLKKDGIRLYFETDYEEACKLVKAAIKNDPMGGALLVTVKTEEYI